MISRPSILVVLAATVPLAACGDPNTVLFVTNTSLGINFDSKPPTANIAYDRFEGFIGPRYENGAAPPAVASMETDGKIFSPQVRQTYATGAAAVGVTTGSVPNDAPQKLEGHTDNKKLMYFGTATTFGVKVGFAPTTGAPLPDSFLFGYRRKEASVIPIAEKPVDGKPQGTVTAVYPSVLASMEVNIDTVPSQQGASTGMNTTQYFATGRAAEALSTNDKVRAAFVAKAERAALAGLTDKQLELANQKAAAFRQTHTDQQTAIMAYLQKDGPFTTDKLKALVVKARAAGGTVPDWVDRVQTADELQRGFRRAPIAVETLYNATQS